MITLPKSRTYSIETKSGYFYMDGKKYKNGVFSIAANTVITLEDNNEYLKIPKTDIDKLEY